MKSYIVTEINNKKTILISSDGEIIEVRTKKGWQIGDVIKHKKKQSQKKYIITVAACVILIFGLTISPVVQTIMPYNDVPPTTDEIVDEKPSMSPIEFKAQKDGLIVADNYGDLIEKLDLDDRDSLDRDIVSESDSLPPSSSDEGNVPLFGGNSSSKEKSGKSFNLAPNDTGQTEKEEAEQSSDDNYSETNIQVEGVKEADIVITDGKYIYAINDKYLYIADSNNGKPAIISKIHQNRDYDQKYSEMYVSGNRLIVFRDVNKKIKGNYTMMTQAKVFDIENKYEPELLETFEQNGEYVDSRLIDDKLYIVSNHFESTIGLFKKDDPKTYLPLFYQGKDSFVSEPKDIAMITDDYRDTYTLISGIDVGNKPTFISKKTIYGHENEIYCNDKNMYLYSYAEEDIYEKKGKTEVSTSATRLTKIDLNNGNIKIKGSTSIPGSILNQFSLDEYDGVLRLVTTVNWNSEWYDDEYEYYDDWGTYNALFTLDSNLNVLGKISNIAPEEMIYSCRFMDDLGYFVTFKNVDPLFTVDLKNPSKPKIIGKLKIPGFSDYLHPYNDGRLLGIGNDADGKTGESKDVKLTMFNNKDPKDVKEKHTHILKGIDYSEVSYNHKAILVDEKRNIIAFPADNYYFIFTYNDRTGFHEKVKIKIPYEDMGYEEYGDFTGIRGLFINEIFYVIAPKSISTFWIKDDFKKLHKTDL